MAYKKSNPNGQAAMAASEPVVIASDQSAIPVSLASVPSHAVTNAGTFAVQSTLQAGSASVGTVVLTAETTKVIGTINIAASQTVAAVTNLAQMGGAAIALNTGARSSGTQRVTIATDDVVPVTDNSGSLTVDAPVGTPAFVRLSDGAAAIATLPVSADSLPLPSGAATEAKQPALGTAGTANANVITIQGIASMTKVLVTPDSVALPANQSVNVAQINGVTTLMGNGATGTGSIRVTIANDNTAIPVATHAVTVASGGIASGAVLSGAFASGSIASGAIASGAIASGAIASGAIASGAIASGAIAVGAFAAGATSIAANEDDASASQDRGLKILAIQRTTPADTAGTDLDYSMLQMKNGRLWAAATVTNTTATDLNAAVVGTGTAGTPAGAILTMCFLTQRGG